VSGAARSLGNHRLTLENVPLRQKTRKDVTELPDETARGNPATWGDSVHQWETYLDEKANQYLVFVGQGAENSGEILTAPYSHRFQEGYTRMQYAKIQGFIRGALKEYDDPHLVFLTFSTSTLKPNGEPRPPLDHMDELLDPWGDGVYYELNRVMAGDRKRDPWEPRPEWEYLFILEPTTNRGRVSGGYPHAHAALVVDGEVSPERFESVITRHLVECEGARGEAHEFDDAIEVKRAESLGNPGAYLFKYLGKSWDVEEMEDYERRFAALLFDQGRQRFRASNGAQRWMQRPEDEAEVGEWMFAGVADQDQAAHLRRYEDHQDFLIENETGGGPGGGVRAWLARQRPPPDVEPEPEGRSIRELLDSIDAEPGEVVDLAGERFVVTPSGLLPPSGAGLTPSGDRPPPAPTGPEPPVTAPVQ